MKFLHTIGDTVAGAVKSVADKNRRAAAVTRLKLVIKTEEDNANEAYIALGKYYYSRLRSEFNNETEPFCVIVDNASRRIDKAVAGIEKLTTQIDSAQEPTKAPAPATPVLSCAVLEEDAPKEPAGETADRPEAATQALPAQQEWNEWVHTVHLETADPSPEVTPEPEPEKADEVAQNFDPGIPW